MTGWRDDRVGSALRGENPTVIARLPRGFAVMGDPQWLPGYCVLLTDDPGIEQLSDLPRRHQVEYLESVAALGRAVEYACRVADSSFRRVNIEILGNADAFLHTHVWPRYEWEPAELVHCPVWLYPPDRWHDTHTALSSEHDTLRAAVADHLFAEGGRPPDSDLDV